MGLSNKDIDDITKGWLDTFRATQEYILAQGAYTWSLIPHQENANAMPELIDPGSCAAKLRSACASGYDDAPLLMGIQPGNSTHPLPNLHQDVAAFLLMRGPHAWLGYGVWGMSWPIGMEWNTNGTVVLRPPELDIDYGHPLAPRCSEPSPGVFQRAYSNYDVALDCNTFTPTLEPRRK